MAALETVETHGGVCELGTTVQDFYEVPVHRHIDIPADGFQLGAAIHAFPTHEDIDLEFFANVVKGEILYVILHGAINLQRDGYPRFDHVSTNLAAGNPFVSFADPTLAAAQGLSLTWYLGTPGWDPQTDIGRVVSRLIDQVGAKHVVFIGGFAAMRCSAQFSESLAFVCSPQTVVLDYKGRERKQYLDFALDGVSKNEMPTDLLTRFDLKATHASQDLANYVYYYQNLNDPVHIADHYNPFRRACGLTASEGIDPTGRRLFVLDDSERIGHGPPSPTEFQSHLALATQFAFPSLATGKDSGSSVKQVPMANRAQTVGVDDFQELREQLTVGLGALSAQYRSLSRMVSAVPGDVEALSRFTHLLFSPDAVLPRLGGFALRAETLLWIVHRILNEKPEYIVECGSGTSTVWMAAVCKHLGRGRVYALENDTFYAEQTRAYIRRNGLEDYASVLDAPLEKSGDSGSPWYSNDAVKKLPGNIDLLLVDGPPAAVGPLARMPVVKSMAGLLRNGSVVVIDDANRSDERRLHDEWLRSSSGGSSFSTIAKLSDAVVVVCESASIAAD